METAIEEIVMEEIAIENVATARAAVARAACSCHVHNHHVPDGCTQLTVRRHRLSWIDAPPSACHEYALPLVTLRLYSVIATQ